MKALVLTGGSIKGAWAAGAIKAVLEAGFVPDIITGISVGALNGAYLTNDIAKQNDWILAGINLTDFWITRIKQPGDIFKKKSGARIALDILRKRFDGIVSVKPLWELVEDTIKVENLQRSPVKYFCGYVNIRTGEILYSNNHNETLCIDSIIASTAIPITMPLVNGIFADGGLRDNAPLKTAIDNGATEIIVIATLPETLDYYDGNLGNVMEYADRLMEIIVNNTLNDDLKEVERINGICRRWIPADSHTNAADKREIGIKVIRPATQIKISLDSFTEKDIARTIDEGYATAKANL